MTTETTITICAAFQALGFRPLTVRWRQASG